jgi:hypothetical protein
MRVAGKWHLCGKNMARRYALKCKLVRLLHTHKRDRKLIRQLFRVIDWMMTLPPELETKLDHFIVALEEGQKMEYVTSIERVRSARILQEGKSSMLSRLLQRRFGDLPPSAEERIKSATAEQTEAWFDRAIDAQSLDEVFQDLPH